MLFRSRDRHCSTALLVCHSDGEMLRFHVVRTRSKLSTSMSGWRIALEILDNDTSCYLIEGKQVEAVAVDMESATPNIMPAGNASPLPPDVSDIHYLPV